MSRAGVRWAGLGHAALEGAEAAARRGDGGALSAQSWEGNCSPRLCSGEATRLVLYPRLQ